MKKDKKERDLIKGRCFGREEGRAEGEDAVKRRKRRREVGSNVR